MAVGGMGMLSTSNYAARRFGVRAAMPGFIARKALNTNIEGTTHNTKQNPALIFFPVPATVVSEHVTAVPRAGDRSLQHGEIRCSG